PVQGKFDETYLDRIAAVVDLCAKRDILVLLDFHQDGFSKEIGQDGAPRWVLDLLLGPDGYPYEGGPLTDLDARRFAPWTPASFRGFSDEGMDVQALSAAAAGRLARRFRGSRAVAGYELMNEPLLVPGPDAEAQLLAFHVRIATAIRRVDRRHLIVFEPNTLR